MIESLHTTTPQYVNTGKDTTTDKDNRASVPESLQNTTPLPVTTGKDASTDTDNRASVRESLHNTTPQSVNAGKDTTTYIDNRASVTESLHNTTLQSVNPGKDTTTDIDNRASVTESLHNTTLQSVNPGKDTTTDIDNRASVTESLHNTTLQSVNPGKDTTTDIDNRASVTESLHNTTLHSVNAGKDTTTDIDNRASVTESLHNTTPHSVNIGKDAGKTGEYVRSPPITHKPGITMTTMSSATTNTDNRTSVTIDPSIVEIEANSYNYIHTCSTCAHKCGLREAQLPMHCYCDRACIQLGDCCLDYEASCMSGPTVTSKNYGDILRSRKSRAAKCVEIRGETGKKETLMVVSSCGYEIMTTTDIDAVNRCERPFATNEGLVAVIPVMFRDVIYSNKYCAMCNNPGDNFTDMVTAGVAFTCSDYECEIKFDLSHLYYIFQGNGRYTCRLEGECNAALADPQFDFDYLRTSCQKYRAPIFHNPSYTYHSNPHCALCSGFDVFDIRCGYHGETFCTHRWLCELTFGRMTDFELLTETAIIAEPLINASNRCVGDRMFNINNMVCPLICPAGHMGVRDKKCARLNVTVPQILSTKRDVRIYVVISTEQIFFRHVDQKQIIKYIDVDVVENSTRCNACKAFKVWYNWNEVISNTSTCWFQETLSRNVGYVVNQVDRFIRYWDVNSRINIFVLNHGAKDIPGSCLNGSPKIQRDLVFPKDGTCLDKPGCTFQIEGTVHMYNVDEVPVVMSWRNTKSGWSEKSTAMVCEPDIFSCDTVTFQADEYITEGESLVLYGGTSHEVKMFERNVLRLDSKAIVLCASLLFNITGTININHDDNKPHISVEVILTLIGNCLSMACLAFTMTTYCMFEEIRSRAGKCVMNLCGALFFAQLSFQVSDAFLSYSEACTTVAVFQHYIWLVVFLWMNVLAFDISCTFADLKPSSNVPNASRLRAFALYAWGLPAVFVGVCLVLDIYTKLPFSYGSKNMCWIVNGRAVLYVFGSPIAVVITANAVLFVRTVVALRRAMSTASRARPPKQQRRTFVIYLRLTSLMGFVWLFGFLANVDGLGFLYYPFILCNTFQGVFMCVSFTLTPTVRRLWRDWRNTNYCRNTSEIST